MSESTKLAQKIEKKNGNSDKNKKPNRLASIPKYVREVIAEIKRVSWPTRQELINATTAVVVFVIVMAIMVGAFDFGLGKLLQLLYKA